MLVIIRRSCSTRSNGGHNTRGNDNRRWTLLHATYLWTWLALRTVMLQMLGFAERSNKPSATKHTADINIIILPFYTLPKKLSPRMDRCTTSSNTGKQHTSIQISYFAQKLPTDQRTLWIKMTGTAANKTHNTEQKYKVKTNKTQTQQPTKRWNSHRQIHGAKNT